MGREGGAAEADDTGVLAGGDDVLRRRGLEGAGPAHPDLPYPRPSWRTTLHLLGFGVLTALILLLAKGPPVDGQDTARVAFTTADLAQVRATFERTWSRPPTAVEFENAFERYVRSEVLYREALERGPDRNDPVVKMSLVRKITMLGTAQAQAAEPTDEELEAYFDLRAERYRVPASLSLVQVYHAEVLPRYQVVYDDGVLAALEGPPGGAAPVAGPE